MHEHPNLHFIERFSNTKAGRGLTLKSETDKHQTPLRSMPYKLLCLWRERVLIAYKLKCTHKRFKNYGQQIGNGQWTLGLLIFWDYQFASAKGLYMLSDYISSLGCDHSADSPQIPCVTSIFLFCLPFLSPFLNGLQICIN